MIEVYAYSTPNSVRVPIGLEEMGLEYCLKSINVRKGEQKTVEYLSLNPNGKVPVLVDPNGPAGRPFVLTESAAILIYLAEKTGLLLPHAGEERARVFEQIMFHVTGVGPAFGQAGYFQKQAPEPVPLALARFNTESARVMAVLDGLLHERQFAAGDDYSIADIVHFGWLWRREFASVDLAIFPNVKRWYDLVAVRPAVLRGLEKVAALVPPA
ncbi:MAG TPA: glutathione S-transferase N-terminal domain-containing protein [Steroidobacteraceae bacterium]